MPDFGYLTNLTPQIQPMNIGGMVDLARGVQAYQQALEANPLAIETAKQQLYRLQQLTPEEITKARAEARVSEQTAQPRISAAQAQARTAETGAQKAEFEFDNAQIQAMNNIAGGILNDPNLKDPKRVETVLEQAKSRAFNALRSDPQAKQKVDAVFAPLFDYAKKQPEYVPQVINNLVQQGIGPAGQQTLQTGGTIDINGVKYYMNPATRQLEQLGAGKPTEAGTQAPPKPSIITEDMPITGANIAQLTKQQADRYETGVKLIDESVKAGQNAQESKQSIRKINEYINKASGSAPGQALRKAGKWLLGDTEVEILMKNLADQQLRMANAMGVPTNMARETSDLASGSADITPKALKAVVDRSDAMNTAVDEFRAGLKKYVDKPGNALNGPIHANKFQQAWADNYDVRIFLAKNIQDSNMSAAEKAEARRQILSRMTQKEMKELQEKANNIEILMKGGFK